MLISSRTRFSNIGKRLDGWEWVVQKWNPRYHQAVALDDTGLPGTGGSHWLLRRGLAGAYSWGRAVDSLRDWTTPYQDIVVVFNDKMYDVLLTPGGVATGHTISVNGSPQTTYYQSGGMTATWILRVPVLFDRDDIVTYSYDPAVGATYIYGTAVEMAIATNRPVNNMLTRRIRFTLKKSDNSLVVSETVKLAVHSYNGGTVEGPGDNADYGGLWMKREMELLATTDINGLLDVLYTGPGICGSSVYVVLFRPNFTPTESMAWVDTVK